MRKFTTLVPRSRPRFLDLDTQRRSNSLLASID